MKERMQKTSANANGWPQRDRTASEGYVGAQTYMEIIKSESDDFARLYRLLTNNQAQLLYAIADEGAVTAINATAFITAHHQKGTSSINKALEALIDKEYVYASGHGYIVYDRFMGLWLQTIL